MQDRYTMQHIHYKEIIQTLWEWKIVAIPTETVYGLAINALDENAIQRLFNIKWRPQNKPMNIQIGHKQDIYKYAYIDHPREEEIIQHYMPGPLTLILRKKNIIPDILTAHTQYIGIRIPAHTDTLTLLQQIDFPLAVPSANLSDQKPAETVQEAQQVFWEKVAYYMPNNYIMSKQASTVVQIINNEIIIHRAWPISYEDIKNIIKKGA